MSTSVTITDEHERREVLAVLASRLASRTDDYNCRMQHIATRHPSPTMSDELAEARTLRARVSEVEVQLDELTVAELPTTVEFADLTAEQTRRELAGTIETVGAITSADSHDRREDDLERLYTAGLAANRLIGRLREAVA